MKPGAVKSHHDLSLRVVDLVERIPAALGFAVLAIPAASRRNVVGEHCHGAIRVDRADIRARVLEPAESVRIGAKDRLRHRKHHFQLRDRRYRNGALQHHSDKRPGTLSPGERHQWRHGWHRWALAVPFFAFPVLYFLPWNPIYAGIAAMVLERVAAVLCGPIEVQHGDRRNIVPGALHGFSAGNRVVGAGLHRTGLELRGDKWSASLRLATGRTAVRAFVRSFLAGMYEHFTWKRSVAA